MTTRTIDCLDSLFDGGFHTEIKKQGCSFLIGKEVPSFDNDFRIKYVLEIMNEIDQSSMVGHCTFYHLWHHSFHYRILPFPKNCLHVAFFSPFLARFLLRFSLRFLGSTGSNEGMKNATKNARNGFGTNSVRKTLRY